MVQRPGTGEKPIAIPFEKLAKAKVLIEDSPVFRGAEALVDFARLNLEDAISLLQKERDRDPLNQMVANNLAVAYLSSAQDEENRTLLFEALRVLGPFHKRDSLSLEMHFNLALTFQSLRLDLQAKEAWQAYLKRETDPIWGAEASSHLPLLDRPKPKENWEIDKDLLPNLYLADQQKAQALVRQYRDRARRHLEGELLQDWAEGSPDALPLMAFIAGVLDLPELKEAVTKLESLASNDEEREHLAAAVAWLTEAKKRHKEKDYEYDDLLDRAETAVRRSGTGEPFLSWVQLQRARMFINTNQDKELFVLSQEIAIRAKNYPSLLALAKGFSGLMRGYGGESLASTEDTLAALEYSLKIGDNPWINHYFGQLADNLSILGRHDLSLAERIKRLDLIDHEDRPEYRMSFFSSMGRDLQAMGKFAEAAYFFEEKHRLTLAMDDPLQIASSLWTKAGLHWRQGHYQEAHRFLEEAFVYCDKADPVVRAEQEAELHLAMGEILRADNPAGAREHQLRALQLFETAETKLRHSDTYLALGLTSLAENDSSTAMNYFREGIHIAEAQRKKAPHDHTRVSFFDQSAGLFEHLIQSYLDRGDDEGALAYAERSRARFVAEKRLNQEPWSGRPTSLVDQDEALIVYHLLPDKLAIWVISDSNIQAKTVPLEREDLKQRIARLQEELKDDNTQSLERLFQWLIEPVKNLLVGKERVVFSPHAELWGTPFAALLDPGTGRFLAQEFPSALIPSLTLMHQVRRIRNHQRPGRRDGGLVFGEPAHDLRVLPLPRLRWSGKEAVRVREKLNGLLFMRTAATEEAFAEHAPQSGVIHFAGHAVVNPRHPLESFILLAPNSTTGSSGFLTAAKIYDETFADTELAVLSACQTGAPDGSISEGGGVLAGAFLARGVTEVVATLYPIRDHPNTVEFIDSFYTSWLSPEQPSAATALNQAQLEAIASGLPVRLWGAYQVIGNHKRK